MAEVPFLDLRAAHEEIRADIDAAMARVVDSGHYVLGPEVEGFEQAFAAHCGRAHGIGVGSGLDALLLVLKAIGVGAGDEVIVPTHTFIATWLAVSHSGATPVGVEPDPRTCNLDVDRLEAAITPRTRAIIPVHLYGLPAAMGPITEIARRRGLFVLADAAQAHGATYRGRPAGSWGDAAAFSFYPGKNLGAIGDAGAIVTDDDDLAHRIRILRNYGSEQKYVHDVIGFNNRLDPLQAAVLTAKLGHLDAWNARRRDIAALYQQALVGIDGLTLPHTPADCTSSWHLYVVRHAQRDRLQQALRERGVQTLIHYPIPPHLQKGYAEHRQGPFPIAEQLAAQVLSLPMGPHLGVDAAQRVVEAVREACATLS